ncbi:MAG: FAD:protein FMN transferase [Eubacteriales bacterium]|nr:FAD:protein FMN transferase [Eubacteriales bacterium]
MKKYISCLVLASAALVFSGCGKQTVSQEPEVTTGFALDTSITITIYGGEKGLGEQCIALCEDYEKLFSRTLEGSDIYQINHAAGAPVEVSDDTISLLKTALSYSELSDGAFDCTIAPVSALWDFKNNTGTVPEAEALQEAVSLVDYRTVSIDGNSVTLENPQAALDLGGIAKGYIADRLKEFLLEEGISGATINLGGNVLAIGEKPSKAMWKIAIQKPFAEHGEVIEAVSISEGSVVTSGVYERYFTVDGQIYHHLLDPETGYPVQNELLSVTIVSENSVDGDALSTICFVLGYEKGAELIQSLNEPGLEAIFVFEDESIQKVSASGQAE